jgi:Glyoxalase-like domain
VPGLCCHRLTTQVTWLLGATSAHCPNHRLKPFLPGQPHRELTALIWRLTVPTRLIRVVFEALDVHGQACFWAAALGWPLDEHPHGDGASVGPRDGESHLLFVPSDELKTAKNRLHLDLADRPDQARKVDHLIGLGAVRADIGQGQVPWEVLADPEGNEFCVLAEADPYTAEGPLVAISLDAAKPAVQGRF